MRVLIIALRLPCKRETPATHQFASQSLSCRQWRTRTTPTLEMVWREIDWRKLNYHHHCDKKFLSVKATFNQLEAFYWIVRLGSFRAAARRLNLTQPTISLRVRGLEQALGLRLFERAGRHARPTTVVASLLPQAEQLLRLAAELDGKSTRVDPLRGHLHLGAPDSFGLICMPALLGALKKQYPELHVRLTIDNSLLLSRKLNARELDVAFLVEPKVEPHVRIEPLGVIENAWIASPKLRLPRGIVRPQDLAHHDIFTNPEPSSLMAMIRDWFSGAGVEPGRLCTCNSLSVILRLTIAGAGVSLLPTAMLSTERAGRALRVLRIRPVLVQPHLYGAYQIDKAGQGVQAIMELARQVVAKSRLVAST